MSEGPTGRRLIATDLHLGAFLEPGESVLWSLVGAGKALSQRILAGSDRRLFQVDPGRSTSVRSWPVADVVSVDDNGKWIQLWRPRLR